MKNALAIIPFLMLALASYSQPAITWSDVDRKYLLDNLSRSRDSIISETKDLSQAQWNFKESPERWSVNQVVEHLAIWELLLQREISQALAAGARPELNDDKKRTDTSIVQFLMEENQHITTNYTKPFTYTVPMGINQGEHNLSWFLKLRNESIGFADSTTTNLRAYFLRQGRGNVHQVLITIFAHTDRHLRQIRRVKSDPRYPKK